ETRKIASRAIPQAARFMRAPMNGAKIRNASPCTVASVAPPRTLPSTIAERLAGDTSTESKKPSRRSSITDNIVKIAGNDTNTMSRVPYKHILQARLADGDGSHLSGERLHNLRSEPMAGGSFQPHSAIYRLGGHSEALLQPLCQRFRISRLNLYYVTANLAHQLGGSSQRAHASGI